MKRENERKISLNKSVFYVIIFKRQISFTHTHTHIYIVLFGPVKPELGVIPSGQENHSGAEHLNFPGGGLNVIFYRAIFL